MAPPVLQRYTRNLYTARVKEVRQSPQERKEALARRHGRPVSAPRSGSRSLARSDTRPILLAPPLCLHPLSYAPRHRAPTGRGGFILVETNDPKAITAFAAKHNYWNDVKITPVLDVGEVVPISASALDSARKASKGRSAIL
ncbi:MAG: DUF3303 domain-containing protein [Bradyrhizobium sp.]